MYIPEHFNETRTREIARIISDHPLAILVATGSAGLVANHIPILEDGPDRLIGHVALNNDLHRELADGTRVLAIFRAADGYVSPNWYPSKQVHHRHVPTWNYQAVHVEGAIRFLHDVKTKTAIVGKLTKHFERRQSGDEAWRMADAPRDYLAAMLDNIVAFEIGVDRVLAKSKLSQNRETEDFDGAVDGLVKAGRGELGAAMKALKSPQ